MIANKDAAPWDAFARSWPNLFKNTRTKYSCALSGVSSGSILYYIRVAFFASAIASRNPQLGDDHG